MVHGAVRVVETSRYFITAKATPESNEERHGHMEEPLLERGSSSGRTAVPDDEHRVQRERPPDRGGHGTRGQRRLR